MSTKRKIITIVAALFIAVAASAQAPQMLDDNHAMQRIQVQQQYLLLPDRTELSRRKDEIRTCT